MHPKCAGSVRLGTESSSELELTATSTTLAAYIRYRIDFKLSKLAFLARSSSTRRPKFYGPFEVGADVAGLETGLIHVETVKSVRRHGDEMVGDWT